MGDIFFFLKMIVFTVLLVFVLQVKIGPTTLEEKVMSWTHKSEFSKVIQGVAAGGIKAIGIGYDKVRGLVTEKVSKEYSDSQAPGGRLKSTLDDSRAFFKETFSGETSDAK